jgi:hypothetical protein
VWRYHPFFTNTELPVEQADITHRQHAIIETVFADLIDGPLAHMPSGGPTRSWHSHCDQVQLRHRRWRRLDEAQRLA